MFLSPPYNVEQVNTNFVPDTFSYYFYTYSERKNNIMDTELNILPLDTDVEDMALENALNVSKGKLISKTFIEKIVDSLNKIKNLKNNWDGMNGISVSESIYDFMLRVFKSCPNDQIVRNWTLAPVSNGSLMMAYSGKKRATISIGEDGFSFFSKIGNQKFKGHNKLSEERIIETLKRINTLINDEQ